MPAPVIGISHHVKAHIATSSRLMSSYKYSSEHTSPSRRTSARNITKSVPKQMSYLLASN